ncbi:MAG: hypothetical protein EXQ96_03350 [Alphaproteobacteria bacterium]|nr:hypothetical protein [Alphaproteobacteria bacterium]
MGNNLLPPPPGWGTDTLTGFIEAAYRNRFATFANKRDWFQRLTRLDACFLRIAKDCLNPSDYIAALLFMRCHSAYRAACEHALAGQCADLFPQVRVCLEYAGYALHIHRNAGLGEKWLRRHDDKATKRAVKNEFTVSNIRTTIGKINEHAAKVFDELYQRTIDLGAHPNEQAVTGSLAITKQENRTEFQQIHLHSDSLSLDHGLRTTAQTGVCSLEIFQGVFAERFELLGIRAEFLKLRKGL